MTLSLCRNRATSSSSAGSGSQPLASSRASPKREKNKQARFQFVRFAELRRSDEQLSSTVSVCRPRLLVDVRNVYFWAVNHVTSGTGGVHVEAGLFANS